MSGASLSCRHSDAPTYPLVEVGRFSKCSAAVGLGVRAGSPGPKCTCGTGTPRPLPPSCSSHTLPPRLSPTCPRPECEPARHNSSPTPPLRRSGGPRLRAPHRPGGTAHVPGAPGRPYVCQPASPLAGPPPSPFLPNPSIQLSRYLGTCPSPEGMCINSVYGQSSPRRSRARCALVALATFFVGQVLGPGSALAQELSGAAYNAHIARYGSVDLDTFESLLVAGARAHARTHIYTHVTCACETPQGMGMNVPAALHMCRRLHACKARRIMVCASTPAAAAAG
jgi:hypothetical protein